MAKSYFLNLERNESYIGASLGVSIGKGTISCLNFMDNFVEKIGSIGNFAVIFFEESNPALMQPRTAELVVVLPVRNELRVLKEKFEELKRFAEEHRVCGLLRPMLLPRMEQPIGFVESLSTTPTSKSQFGNQRAISAKVESCRKCFWKLLKTKGFSALLSRIEILLIH